MREGRFYPDHGLERIVEYHERQDRRFAEAAAELSDRTGKPILSATDLAVADPANPGPATVRSQRPAGLPERRPCRHGPRPPLPVLTAPPAPSAHERRRTGPVASPTVGPLVVLGVAALIPALLLWSVFRWADGRADAAADAVPTPVAPARSGPDCTDAGAQHRTDVVPSGTATSCRATST